MAVTELKKWGVHFFRTEKLRPGWTKILSFKPLFVNFLLAHSQKKTARWIGGLLDIMLDRFRKSSGMPEGLCLCSGQRWKL